MQLPDSTALPFTQQYPADRAEEDAPKEDDEPPPWQMPFTHNSPDGQSALNVQPAEDDDTLTQRMHDGVSVAATQVLFID